MEGVMFSKISLFGCLATSENFSHLGSGLLRRDEPCISLGSLQYGPEVLIM